MSSAICSIGVRMKPGQTALTRIPSAPNWAAIERVSPSNPGLGGAVGRDEGVRGQTLDAGDTDHGGPDAGGGRPPQVRQQQLNQHGLRPQIHVQHRVPGLLGVGAHRFGDHPARRMHQAVDAAEGGHRGVCTAASIATVSQTSTT